jgi:hypothetical protein
MKAYGFLGCRDSVSNNAVVIVACSRYDQAAVSTFAEKKCPFLQRAYSLKS